MCVCGVDVSVSGETETRGAVGTERRDEQCFVEPVSLGVAAVAGFSLAEIALAGAYAMLTEQGTTFVRGGGGKTV